MAAWPLPSSPVGSYNKLWMHYDGSNWPDAWNSCIKGRPEQTGADVLCNCTGWCEGRMLQLYMMFNPSYDPGTLGTHLFMDFGYHNAGQEWLDVAQSKGFDSIDQPEAGAVLVTRSHVAVIEDYDPAYGWLVSESGYDTLPPFNLHYSLYESGGVWYSSYATDPEVIGFFRIPTVIGPIPGHGYDRRRRYRNT